jgi:hypothetical protein
MSSQTLTLASVIDILRRQVLMEKSLFGTGKIAKSLMKSLITEAMSITSNSSPFKQKVLRMTRIVRRNFRF